MTRSYSELSQLETFEERFEYLRLNGSVGSKTFDKERYLNQGFYQSPEWKRIRDKVIVRDMGCDLGIQDRPIVHDIHVNGKVVPTGRIYIHHMNPITPDDIIHGSDYLINPEYLICVSFETHNAIHYGSLGTVEEPLVVRTRNDTCPWKRETI